MVYTRNKFDRTVAIMKKQVDRLSAWGFPAACLYMTKGGALSTYGSAPIRDVLLTHKAEIFSREDYKTAGAEVKDQGCILPQIHPPLQEWTFACLRDLVGTIVRADKGYVQRNIGWGEPGNRPEWWPNDIPWTKRGVQSGVNSENLKRLIRACYRHHGQKVDETDTDIVLEEMTGAVNIAEVLAEYDETNVNLEQSISEHETPLPGHEIIYLDPQGSQDSDNQGVQVILPLLHKPLEQWNFQESKEYLLTLVKASMGCTGRMTGWGDEDMRPAWWGADIPWTKRGVQAGLNSHLIKQLIRACYQHHGHKLQADPNDIDHEYPGEIIATESNQVLEQHEDHPQDHCQLSPTSQSDDSKGAVQCELSLEEMWPELHCSLSDLRYQRAKEHMVRLMQITVGPNKRIYWGDPETRPEWWPDDIPWTKRGVQAGLNLTQLKRLIRQCYSHYGQKIKEYDENEALDHSSSADCGLNNTVQIRPPVTKSQPSRTKFAFSAKKKPQKNQYSISEEKIETDSACEILMDSNCFKQDTEPSVSKMETLTYDLSGPTENPTTSRLEQIGDHTYWLLDTVKHNTSLQESPTPAEPVNADQPITIVVQTIGENEDGSKQIQVYTQNGDTTSHEPIVIKTNATVPDPLSDDPKLKQKAMVSIVKSETGSPNKRVNTSTKAAPKTNKRFRKSSLFS